MPTRHLLVQQNQVVCILAHELQRVVAVRDRVDVVAPLLKKEQMRLEKVDLVVDPQDALRGAGGLTHIGS